MHATYAYNSLVSRIVLSIGVVAPLVMELHYNILLLTKSEMLRQIPYTTCMLSITNNTNLKGLPNYVPFNDEPASQRQVTFKRNLFLIGK
jgi:hypothetical protein